MNEEDIKDIEEAIKSVQNNEVVPSEEVREYLKGRIAFSSARSAVNATVS